MSYILDALRQAQNDRLTAAGAVDHASLLNSATAAPSLAAHDPATRSVWPRLLILALGIGLGAGALGWWLGTASPALAPTPAVAVSPAPSAAPAKVPTPAPSVALAEVPSPVPSAALAEVPVTAPVPKLAPEPEAKPSAAPASTLSRPAPSATPVVPKATVPAAPLSDRTALPAASQARLPPLQVSGVMASTDPSNRLLILDGQALQEGAVVAPGLVLERIDARRATLQLDGQRFYISY